MSVGIFFNLRSRSVRRLGRLIDEDEGMEVDDDEYDEDVWDDPPSTVNVPEDEVRDPLPVSYPVICRVNCVCVVLPILTFQS